jgi:hypothetical protein
MYVFKECVSMYEYKLMHSAQRESFSNGSRGERIGRRGGVRRGCLYFEVSLLL